MINKSLIRNEARRRLIAATEINPLSDLQCENQIYNPQGKTFWITEHIIGGLESSLGKFRSRINPFLIQYDLHVPAGSGSDVMDEKISLIKSEFSVNDLTKCFLILPGYDISITNLLIESAEETEWHVQKILIYLNVLKVTAVDNSGTDENSNTIG